MRDAGAARSRRTRRAAKVIRTSPRKRGPRRFIVESEPFGKSPGPRSREGERTMG
jgi:hypothetical protein